MNKFIKDQEKQEILVYTVIFLVVFFLLFNFVGVSFDFSIAPHYLESKKNFGEIKVKLEKSKEMYNINELRTFELIPSFDGAIGKEDPFSREVVVRKENEENPEDIGDEPETSELPEENPENSVDDEPEISELPEENLEDIGDEPETSELPEENPAINE
jgi:hypothetical protein